MVKKLKSYQNPIYLETLKEKLQESGKNFSKSNYLTAKIQEMRKPSVLNSNRNFNTNIEFGTPLESIPKEHIQDVLNFVGYLDDTANKSFKIKGYNKKTQKLTEKDIPYVHRWTAIYRKGLLAKLYQLESYLGDFCSNVTMITLTIKQKSILGKSLDPEDCLLKLKKCYTKLMDCMRKINGTIDYFYVLEPHKTGYPHMHLMYMKILSDSDKDKILNLWSKKYEAGSYEHGINFAEPKASSNGFFEPGSIGKVRGYLMKYITKGLFKEESYGYQFHGKQVPFNMKPNELLFNSLLKKTKTRLWNASRNFSQVMKKPITVEEELRKLDWECTEVSQWYNTPSAKDEITDNPSLNKSKQLINVIWSKEGGLRPETIKEWVYSHSLPHISNSDIEEIRTQGLKYEYAPFPILNSKGILVDEISNYNIYKPCWHSIS